MPGHGAAPVVTIHLLKACLQSSESTYATISRLSQGKAEVGRTEAQTGRSPVWNFPCSMEYRPGDMIEVEVFALKMGWWPVSLGVAHASIVALLEQGCRALALGGGVSITVQAFDPSLPRDEELGGSTGTDGLSVSSDCSSSEDAGMSLALTVTENVNRYLTARRELSPMRQSAWTWSGPDSFPRSTSSSSGSHASDEKVVLGGSRTTSWLDPQAAGKEEETRKFKSLPVSLVEWANIETPRAEDGGLSEEVKIPELMKKLQGVFTKFPVTYQWGIFSSRQERFFAVRLEPSPELGYWLDGEAFKDGEEPCGTIKMSTISKVECHSHRVDARGRRIEDGSFVSVNFCKKGEGANSCMVIKFPCAESAQAWAAHLEELVTLLGIAELVGAF